MRAIRMRPPGPALALAAMMLATACQSTPTAVRPLRQREALVYLDELAQKLRDPQAGAAVRVRRVPDAVIVELAAAEVFITDGVALRDEAGPLLDALARRFNEFSRTLIVVNVHSDALGRREINLDFTRQRAASLAERLQQRSVDPRRVLAAGLGEAVPAAPNGSREGRIANRRVEIRVEALRTP